ncbi:hypothetical protein V5799_027431 [Amblyomma americanum]|uniref:Uncharacterized protein n=1 Tax=Amblyomma americanum TaxID=6943 RepID=A0AAQ4DFR1_AMBAM
MTPTTSGEEDTQMVKPHSKQLLILGASLGAVFCVVLFAVLLAVLLGKTKAYPEAVNVDPFCCPEEALMVLRAVNLSVDPCEDFYGHVCSRANVGDYEHVSPLLRVAMVWSLMKMAGMGPGSSAAGHLLTILKQGLWEIDHSSGKDVAEYATAIAQTGAPSRNINGYEMVNFLAKLSFKYGLPAVVSFSVSEQGTVLNIKAADDCFSSSEYEDILPSVLDAVNGALNTSVSAKQLLRIKDDIAALLGASHSRNQSHRIEISPFTGLAQREWAGILNNLVFPLYPNVTTVATRQPEGISHLLAVLANETIPSVAEAYVIVCAALKTRDALAEASVSHGLMPASTSCHDLNICELEDAFEAELVNRRRLIDYVRALFMQIKDTVTRDAPGHPLFYGITGQETKEKLSQLKLVLPEQIAVLDIAVPAVSDSFAANFLAARSYTFDVRRAKIARGIPDADSFFLPVVVRHGNAIFFPTNLLALLAQNHRRNIALDLPVAGVGMAAQCWSFLLEASWSGESRSNIKRRLECIEKNRLNGSDATDSVQTAAAALGLVSAIDAMMPLQWNVLYSVNNTEISLARLVFLLWAYSNCATIPGVVLKFDVNLALRSSHVFRTVFGCSQHSPMVQQVCCLENC